MNYVCLLRGINVSGKNIIKMDALKNLFQNMGAQNITTYIQSGNVVFEYPEINSSIIEEQIADQIFSDFGLEVPVMVLTQQKLKQIVDENPFAQDKTKEISFLHVTFLSDKPNAGNKEIILKNKAEAEDISLTDEAVYLYCPKGYGHTKLNNNFIENKLKVQATTRNWKTTLKLLEIASGAEH